MNYSIKAFIKKEDDSYVAECLEIDAAVRARTLDDTVDALRHKISECLHGVNKSDFGLVDDPTLFIVFEDVPIPTSPLACATAAFGVCREGAA